MNVLDPKSINIAIFVWKMCNGGIERQVSLLIPILNQAGYQTILLTNEPATEDDYPIPKSTKRFVLHGNGEERSKRLSEILIQECVDVLFCHKYSDVTLEDDLKTAKKLNIRTLMMWHSVFSTLIAINDEFFDKKMMDVLAADMMLTLSRTDEHFFRCCGIPAKYVPNPMVFQVIHENPRQMGKASPVILFPDRITDELLAEEIDFGRLNRQQAQFREQGVRWLESALRGKDFADRRVRT